jgi:hypothetical protein
LTTKKANKTANDVNNEEAELTLVCYAGFTIQNNWEERYIAGA